MSRLILATHNVGDADPDQVLQLARACHALALQEMGDRADVFRALRAGRRFILQGTGEPGQASTPLVWDARVLTFRAAVYALVGPSRHVGPGAGPSRVKAKWFIGARFIHRPTGRRVIYGSTHLVASQWQPLRLAHARQHVRGLVDELDDRAAMPFIGGDWNTTPRGRAVQPLLEAGWTNDHIAVPRGRGSVDAPTELATHGRRAIDAVWWRRGGDHRYVGHDTVATGSDHHAVIATFELEPRARA